MAHSLHRRHPCECEPPACSRPAGKRIDQHLLADGVPPLDTDQLLRDLFIHGTPEACIAQIQALESRTGIHQLRCVFNANGLWSNATALAGMELFAQEVLPAVR